MREFSKSTSDLRNEYFYTCFLVWVFPEIGTPFDNSKTIFGNDAFILGTNTKFDQIMKSDDKSLTITKIAIVVFIILGIAFYIWMKY